ncbi:unnamed protein product [Closterium sp. NIES-64]|nr:unnamed protein product [Closterium sp. NIES-64]
MDLMYPTDLIVDLLEKHLLAAEACIVVVVLLLTSFVLKRTGLRLLLVVGAIPARAREARVVGVAAVEAVVEAVEVVEVVVVAVGVVVGVGALVVVVVVVAVGVVAAVVAAVGVVAAAVVVVGVEPFRGEVLAVVRGSSSSVRARPLRPSSFVSGLLRVGRLGLVFAARTSFAQVTALVRHAGRLVTHSTAASPILSTPGAQSLATRLSSPTG